MGKTVFLKNIGCMRRELDLQRIKTYLLANNYNVTEKEELSSTAILFSCAFSDHMTQESIEQINLLKKKENFILSGCLGSIEPNLLKENGINFEIPVRKLELIENIFPPKKTRFQHTNDGNIITNFEDKRYLVRISWGCCGNCSYCAIRKAIGSLRSKHYEIILREINEGRNQNIEKFRLVADDGGAYGIDTNSSIVFLLKQIIKVFPSIKIEINISPKWLIKYRDEIIQILNKSQIDCITIPIQSGSKDILDLMNRNNQIDKLEYLLKQIDFKGKRITTHVIIGFPGEKREDLIQTLSILQKYEFFQINVFTYSNKKKTPASRFTQLESNVINEYVDFMQEYLQNQYYMHNSSKTDKWNYIILRRCK